MAGKNSRKSSSKKNKITKKTAPKRAPARRAPPARKLASRGSTRPGAKSRTKSDAAPPPTPESAIAASARAVGLLPGDGRSGLTRADLEQFREILLQKRAELSGDVNTLRAEALNKNRQDAAGDLSSMPLHMADLGTDHYEQEFTLGLMESERQLLQEIDEALARIRNGVYGVCAATGRPIGKARLKAKPWAKHCYEYVLAQERGQQRRI